MTNKIRCFKHLGGPTDLPAEDFYPSDRARAYAQCKVCRARLDKERQEAKKNGTYVPKQAKFAPKKKQPELIKPVAIEPVSELVTPPRFVKIGGYFLAESAVLLADTLQDGKVTLYTTVLEIDGETKHPRNKKLLFTRQHAPDEYNATITWLYGASDAPTPTTSENEQAAMQLAEEAMQQLKAAKQRIQELEAALAPVKALLNGSVVKV